MPRQVTIITPENVGIDYELAGVASRAGAAVIDTLLQLIAIGALVILFLSMGLVGGSGGMSWGMTILIILGFLIFWGYFILFETIWNGQTPGKRYSRLRTVREGGLPVDISCAAVRNLIRIVDILGFYLVGGICVLTTRDNKRLGDLAAGTLVVKERAEWTPMLNQPTAAPRHAPTPPFSRCPEAACVRNIELLTPEEFEAVKRFMERRAELRPDVGERVASRIAEPLMARLGIEENASIIYSNLLSEIYFRCVEERGMR